MADIINLKRARKQRDRIKKRAQGDVNAAKFGRSKSEKSLEKAEQQLETRKLDGAKIDREE